MTDAQIKALDECARAVRGSLADCARTKAINPEEDVSDPAWRLAAETTCLLEAIAELRGKANPRAWYA